VPSGRQILTDEEEILFGDMIAPQRARTNCMRILGEPKPPQTGKFSSKIAKKPVTQPNVKPVKKVS
jgi:hypothetical protein